MSGTHCTDPAHRQPFQLRFTDRGDYLYAAVLGDKRVLLNKPFVSSLKLRETVFDAERMKQDYARFADSTEMQEWNLNPFALEMFISEPQPAPMMTIGKEATA